MNNDGLPNRIFDGLRVVELGEMVAGPFAGTLLAEFGAEVIKVERPGLGDVMRGFGPSVDGKSLYWLAHSAGKKSIILDLARAEGLEVLRELLMRSDVLIDSMRPGTLDRWQLSDSSLHELNPQLVTVHVSGFGASGPYKDKAGYDPVAQGFSGLSYLTGKRDGAPMRAGGSIPMCDFTAGLLGAFGAALSIYARDIRGTTGQTVDVALYDFAFRMIAPLLSYYELTGIAWNRDGNHSLGGAPTGHFLTQDGHWICASVQTDQQFGRLAQLIGRPDWLTEKKYSSLTQRTQQRDALGLGLAACQKGLSVGFITAAALVHELIEARDDKQLLRFQKKLATYKLLIVDELGFVPLSKTGAELLFEVFSQRYERGSTLVTTNLPFDEWTEVFGSERLTGALLDRLTHHVNILEMNGESYRLNQSRRRQTPTAN